jgi:hypothetical protein
MRWLLVNCPDPNQATGSKESYCHAKRIDWIHSDIQSAIVLAFQLVSSTPINGLEMTLVPFKILLCATAAQLG